MTARAAWLERSAVSFGAVAVGLTQIFLSLVLDNPGHFPRSGGFHAWTLFWTLALPLGAVIGLDVLLARKGARLWTALLFAAVLLSFLRQIQVSAPAYFAPWLGGAPPLLLAGALALLLGGLALRWPQGARRYLALMALLGAILVGRYVAGTGLWGPAWISDAPAAAELREPDAPPAYVLVFDELAFDVLHDGKGGIRPEYPSFAGLAADGLLFTRASTNHLWTKQAIPTLLTGRLRPEAGRPSFLDLLGERREVLLFDNALMAQDWVRRDGARRIYSRGKAHYLSLRPLSALRYLRIALGESPFVRTALGEDWKHALPPPAGWEAIGIHEWIGHETDLLLHSIRRDAARGRVTYWHCSVPHAPFVFGPDGRLHGRAADRFMSPIPGRAPHDPREVLESYRLQVGYADALLGRFLARLREEGLYAEAVVAVTSDHGLRTWYGDLEPPGFPEVLGGWSTRVPLILKAPGLRPGVRDVDYQHVDFAPTFLRVLGVPFDPGAYEGRSALDDGLAPRRKLFLGKDGRTYVFDPAAGLWRKSAPGAAPEF